MKLKSIFLDQIATLVNVTGVAFSVLGKQTIHPIYHELLFLLMVEQKWRNGQKKGQTQLFLAIFGHFLRITVTFTRVAIWSRNILLFHSKFWGGQLLATMLVRSSII